MSNSSGPGGTGCCLYPFTSAESPEAPLPSPPTPAPYLSQRTQEGKDRKQAAREPAVEGAPGRLLVAAGGRLAYLRRANEPTAPVNLKSCFIPEGSFVG